MRKAGKCILSFILAMSILFSFIPQTSFAATENTNSPDGDTMPLSQFIKKVEENGGTYNGPAITVLIEPASGCRQNHDEHKDLQVTENTPERIQFYDDIAYTQYQRFEGTNNISISNVTFKLVKPEADILFCGAWNTKQTTASKDKLDAELQFENTENTTFSNCTFDNVAVSPISSKTSVSFDDCTFSGLGGYAIKDVQAATVSITNSNFTDCSGGVYMNGGGTTQTTYTDNTFSNIGKRGAIQFGASGDYSNTLINIKGNSFTAKVNEESGFLRQLNYTLSQERFSGIASSNTVPVENIFTNDSNDTNDQLPPGTSFPNNTTVYDGTNYYATLTDALDAIHTKGENTTILWCKPGANLGSMTHGHVCQNLTIYGNGAYISGGERDFELDTYKIYNNKTCSGLTSDTSLTIYNLNGAAVWGQRNTEYTLNIYLEGCQNMNRVYISGNSGANNITLKDCSFDGSTDATNAKASTCTIYSNAAGKITVDNCTFNKVCEPINLNNKSEATSDGQTILIKNCSFTDCSTTDICTSDKTWAAPIRILSSQGAKSQLNVDACQFIYTNSQTKCNGDILLGDGRENEVSYPVYATLTNTSAEVQIQNPGDRTADSSYAQKINVTANTEPVNLSNAVASINGKNYTSIASAIKEANSGDTITLLSDITVDSWNMIWNIKGITLDGNGHTLKVNAIESGQNHDAVFHSAGENTFKNLTVDLSGVSSNSQAQGSRAFSAAAGDTFDTITIIGNEHIAYGITTGGTNAANETITIKNSTIKNCDYAIYDAEDGSVENLIITGSTISGCNYATILRAANGQFTDNTVTAGKLNIMSGNQIVNENTFTNASTIKFYAAPKSFEKNNISEDSILTCDSSLSATINVANNYWGGGAPSATQIPENLKDKVTGSDVYYTAPMMHEEDLNTYVPPYTGKYSYEINVAKADNGSVSADKYATEGDKVTITVTPDKAYKLNELSVTAGGKDVELTDNGDGTYSFAMPSSKVQITATFIEDEDYVEPTPEPSMPFTDVSENDWFYGAVQYVYDNDMMNGVSATSFAPNSNLTRAMMAAVLYNLEDQPTQADSSFTDVVDGSWYADAVNWAAANNIVSGYGDGIFGPNDNITREQMASILYRYAEYKGYDVSAVGDLSQFNDADSVSEWANDVMRWAVGAGLINGMGDGSVAPQGTATRAQVATVLMNFCENIAK